MAGRTGLEPATSGVTGRRYNQLNYDPKKSFFSILNSALNGRRNRDRTCDISLVRAALSQLSYPPILCSTTAKNILLIRLFACQVTLSQQKIKMTAHAQMTVELLLLEGH